MIVPAMPNCWNRLPLLESLADRLGGVGVAQLPDGRFVDDHRPGAVRRILPGKVATCRQSNPKLFYVVVVRKIGIDIHRLHGAVNIFELPGAKVRPAPRDTAGLRGRVHARDPGNLLFKSRRGGVAPGVQDQLLVFVEPKVLAAHVVELAGDDQGGDDQSGGDGELDDDKRFSQEDAPRPGTESSL